MRPIAILILLTLILCSPAILSQQVPDVQQLVDNIVEEYAANLDSEQDLSELVDDLLLLSEKPLNLNTVSEESLQKLFFLSEFQINSLLSYRDSTGKIMSVYELQLVPGFDIIDVEHLMPFVVAGEPEQLITPADITGGQSEWVARLKSQLETPVGYSSQYSEISRYKGSKLAVNTRYRYRAAKLQVGINTEKDAGEPFFDGTFPLGIDYFSGYIMVNDIGMIKRLVVGDYRAEFGQGLTFWNSLTFGKLSSIYGAHRRGRGLAPHTSAYESLFLQGVGATVEIGKFDFSLFGSYQRIDANISDTVSTNNTYFSSLPETGYHRNFSESSNRKTLPELVIGGNITLNHRRLRAAATFVFDSIAGNYAVNLPIYRLAPVATRTSRLGLAWEYYYKCYHFFGEIGADLISSSSAILLGSDLKLSNTVQVSLLGRSYSKYYENRYTAGLAEGSGTSNEEGLLTGLNVLVAKGWRASGYLDLFRFPWMRYGVYSPSVGREVMFQSEHVLGRNLQGMVRYRYKQAERNVTGSNTPIVTVINQFRQNLRGQFSYQVGTIQLKTTMEMSFYRTDSLENYERGYLIAQDLAFKPEGYPISIYLRFAIFDTQSWDTRVYAYENDMLYSFTVPAYYSNGTRLMSLLKIQFRRNIDLWLRYSLTRYSLLDGIGSGPEQTTGSTSSEVKGMIRLRF